MHHIAFITSLITWEYMLRYPELIEGTGLVELDPELAALPSCVYNCPPAATSARTFPDLDFAAGDDLDT